MQPPPGPIADLAAACVRFVRTALRIELDGTPDTLPLLDHYLESARDTPMGVRELIVPAAGAYFGEVVRGALGGCWTGTAGSDTEWMLEIGDGVVRFNPVGAALEAVLGDDAPELHGHFALREEDRALAEAALAAQPPVEPEAYYRLTTRFEALEVLVDRLITRRTQGAIADDGESGERPLDA